MFPGESIKFLRQITVSQNALCRISQAARPFGDLLDPKLPGAVDMELSREGAGAVPSTAGGHPMPRLAQRSEWRLSERPKRRAERDDRDQAEHGADDADHDNVEIPLAMARSAQRKQRHHCAV